MDQWRNLVNMLINVSIVVLWVVTPCSLVGGNECFGETLVARRHNPEHYNLNHYGSKNLYLRIFYAYFETRHQQALSTITLYS
jgi:hypothetical protein